PCLAQAPAWTLLVQKLPSLQRATAPDGPTRAAAGLAAVLAATAEQRTNLPAASRHGLAAAAAGQAANLPAALRHCLASAIAAVGLAVLCGAADRSLVSAAFGNTIVSTYPDGRTAELWLHPDGGYDAMGRRKDPSSGHWKVKGEKVCLKQKKPIPVPFHLLRG